MPAPGPVQFHVDENPTTVVSVTTSDGGIYKMRMAFVVTGVADSGQINPLDGTPIFHVQSQIVIQIRQEPNA